MNEYDAVALGVAAFGCVLLVLGLSESVQPWPMRLAKIVLAVCCLVGGKLYFMQASRTATFANEADFLADQKRGGFVEIGRFDVSWPAAYAGERVGNDEISFTRQDGTAHTYRGFDGYRLKVVRLHAANGREPIYVLRSQFKH